MDNLVESKKPVYESALEAYQTTIEGDNWKVKEHKNKAYLVIRGKHEDVEFKAALQKLDLILPSSMTITCNDSKRLIWISPDEYLLLIDVDKKEDFILKSKEVFAGVFATVVDNSGGYAHLEISGGKYLEVLAKLSQYSFKNLKNNDVISTLLSKAPTILMRLDENTITILVRFSFADYIWRLLDNASLEYRLDVEK